MSVISSKDKAAAGAAGLAASSGAAGIMVEDVFSSMPYVGGSNVVIKNGLDLQTDGGLVWTKSSYASVSHWLTYTVSLPATSWSQLKILNSDTDGAEFYTGSAAYFDTNGFNIPSTAYSINTDGGPYNSWSFKQADNFFKVVTFTGTGANYQTIAHGLGSTPGMIFLKSRDDVENWRVWHRSFATNNLSLDLNGTGGQSYGNYFNGPSMNGPDSTNFYLQNINTNTEGFVAFVFGHDSSDTSIQKCDSFTTDASGYATVDLGWEPQWVIVKSLNATGDWNIFDSNNGMPGMFAGWADYLKANTSGAQTRRDTSTYLNTYSSGFKVKMATSTEFIYMAIRRGPMREPTEGDGEVHRINFTTAGVHMGSIGGISDVNNAKLDMSLVIDADGNTGQTQILGDRLQGFPVLLGSDTGTYWFYTSAPSPYYSPVLNPAANTAATATRSYFYTPKGHDALNFDAAGMNVSFDTPGFEGGTPTGYTVFQWSRSPGFFDIVQWQGDANTSQTFKHSLGIIPELILAKKTSGAAAWRVFAPTVGRANLDGGTGSSVVWYTQLNNNEQQQLPPSNSQGAATLTTAPTASEITFGYDFNTSGDEYIAYLFGSVDGVSKIGTYTGNGTNQDLNFGFGTKRTNFFFTKRTDSPGPFYIFWGDTNIGGSAPPSVKLGTSGGTYNSTGKAVDQYSAGINVIEESNTNINVNNGKYLYYAIAF